jgi:TonB family protein
MKKISARFVLMLLGTTLLCAAASAQEEPGHGDTCEGPVYKQNEVSRKAVIRHKPDPGFTKAALANNVSGNVLLAAVLCHTGRVTDIQVLKSLPHGLTEQAVAAAVRVEFTPAEKDGRQVATHVKFDFLFNTYGEEVCKPGECAGRLVEELVIEGNRHLTDEEIVRHIKTRPGDAYDEEQTRRDLQALLALPFFDPQTTKLRAEQGARGGVVVIFTVFERPILRDIQFAGLYAVGEEDALKALRESGVPLCVDCPFDSSTVAAAEEVIRKLLAARGRPGATVKTMVGDAPQGSVTLAFIVNERP